MGGEKPLLDSHRLCVTYHATPQKHHNGRLHSEEFHFGPKEPPIIQPGYRPAYVCEHESSRTQD